MFYTVYKVTNTLNGKIYIGCHKTSDLNDGYMGSGKLLKRAIDKYGVENFQKEYIAVFENPEDMFELEATLVNEEFVSREDTYNLKRGGEGGWDHIEKDLSAKREKNIRAGHTTSELLKTDPVLREKWLISIRKAHRRKRTPSISFTFKDRHHTDETKEKMRQKAKERTGVRASQFGTCWITNDIENKKIKKETLNEWLILGWRKGRV